MQLVADALAQGHGRSHAVFTELAVRGLQVGKQKLQGIRSAARAVSDDMLVLGFIEVDGHDETAGLYHLVGLGLARDPDISWEEGLSMQQAADRLRDAGGLVMLAHPYWSGQMSKDLLGLEGCFSLEVYNGGCDVDDAKGYSAVHWDDLLAAGREMWGTAVDDAHWRNGSKDAGLGWVWVKASTLAEESVLQALEKGLFYATCGPEIYDLRLPALTAGSPGDVERGQVSVRCSPVTFVDFPATTTTAAG